MRKDIFKKTFNLTSKSTDHVGFNLFTILGFLESAAIDHAQLMGLGYENMVSTQTFWVLTRQKLNISRWPQVGEIEIQTWSRPLISISATRDFEIFYQGEKIGDCSTRWMVLDATNRRPTRPTFDQEKAITRADYELNYDAEKIEIPSELSTIEKLKVQSSDLDLNNHVNNTKYGQWLMSTVRDRAELSQHLNLYEINFMAETHLNDEVLIQSQEFSTKPTKSFFLGRRAGDQQILFAAILGSSV